MRVPRPLVFWIVSLAAAYAPALLAPASLYGREGGLAELTPDQRQAVEAYEAETVVRAVYDNYTKFSEAGGTPITFELSEFELLLPPRFGEYTIQNIFLAVPLGRIISGMLTIYEHIPELGTKNEGANIIARWKDGASLSEENVQEYLDMASLTTAADFMLEHLNDEDVPDFASILGLMRYKVIATLDQESRTYRASVSITEDKNGNLTVTFNDSVVENLDSPELFHMKPVPPNFLEESQRQMTPLGEAGSCLPMKSGTMYGPLLSARGTEEHLTGHHGAYLELRFICETTSACRSICAPGADTFGCDDSGKIETLGRIHKPASKKDVSSQDGAEGAKSNCGAALGCAFKSCFLTCAGAKVSFTKKGVGAGVTLSSSGADFEFSLNHGTECAGAKPLVAPCPPGPGEPAGCGSSTPGDPSTGGGATGGATNFCTWNCATKWSAQWGLYEACTLTCIS